MAFSFVDFFCGGGIGGSYLFENYIRDIQLNLKYGSLLNDFDI